jgi:cytochrome P450
LVKEVLRLHPPAWWTTREAIHSTEIEGVQVDAGTTFLISPWLFHRDSRHFPNPDEFNPNRQFSSQGFLPFGMGHRTCVGMGVALLELQLIVLEFCAAFRMTLPASPAKPEIPKPGVILSAPELEVCVELRGHPGGGLRVAA